MAARATMVRAPDRCRGAGARGLGVRACTHWKVQSTTPEDIVVRRRPDAVRVTRGDGSRSVLRRPELVGDTLYGSDRDTWSKRGEPRPAVALADVQAIALRRLDPVGSAFLALGTAATAAVAVVGAMWSERGH